MYKQVTSTLSVITMGVIIVALIAFMCITALILFIVGFPMMIVVEVYDAVYRALRRK
jgi:uncharacterized membrane protein YccC